MARIAGIDLPKDKRIEIGLTYIYGIGRKSAKDILAKTGINPDTRVKDLTEDDEAKLREAIDHGYMVEGDLRRSVALDIKRLTEIGCYRRPACPRPAQQDQRPHPQGSQEDHCQQEEVRRENRKWLHLRLARRLSAAGVKRRTSKRARSISVLPSTTPWLP